MLKMKLPATMLAGIGVLGISADDINVVGARDIDPAVLLGISTEICRSPAGGNVNDRGSYKIAAAINELKPYGQLPKTEPDAPQVTTEPPLWNNLGTLVYPVTTRSPQAQKYFNQGLRLAYAFNHEEAARAFRMAQKLDPKCAMCYWGEALVLGPNINMPMDEKAVAPAVDASNKAGSLMKQASSREQALIQALATRYSDDPNVDRKTLDAAYSDAMSKVAARYPTDQNIAVLYAESLMNLSPWDYWEANGFQPRGKAAELVATLEKVLKANPNHPGAIHYYIHVVEASSNPKRAEPYADRLGPLMPGAGHLVHMPSHIYYRVGRYKDSLTTNKKAVAVDEAYLASQKPEGVYPFAYYPHNVHFVLVSAQMAGDGKTAIEAADKLAGLITDDTARTFPIAQPVKAAPYFAHAQFSAPDVVLAVPAPGKGLPYAESLWHYARGVAFAAKGQTADAQEESNEIEKLLQVGDFSELTTAGIPAKEVLQIASLVVQARIAQANDDLTSAAEYFEKAAALEDLLAYMEPPYWYYPVRQSLGAVLLQKGDLDGAEQAFRASLIRVPNNGWALYGLSEVYKKRGDDQRAAATKKLLDKSWIGNQDQLALARL